MSSSPTAPTPTGTAAPAQAPLVQAPFVQVKDLRRSFDVSKPWLNRVLEGGEKQFLKAVDGVYL